MARAARSPLLADALLAEAVRESPWGQAACSNTKCGTGPTRTEVRWATSDGDEYYDCGING
jgi:hypothetical protein